MTESLYSLTLWKSEKSRSPYFKRTFRWSSSDQLPNSLTFTFWELDSDQKFLTFLECKKMEHFYQVLSDEEFGALIDAPGFFSDRLYLDLLQAKAELQSSRAWKENNLTKDLLEQKLQRLQLMLGRPVWNLNLLYTYIGVVNYRLAQIRVPIGKVKKFSGWVRNSSAVGSKRRTGSLEILPEIQESISFVELDYFSYFMAPKLDFHDLGFPAETFLYKTVQSYFDQGKVLPENLLNLLR